MSLNWHWHWNKLINKYLSWFVQLKQGYHYRSEIFQRKNSVCHQTIKTILNQQHLFSPKPMQLQFASAFKIIWVCLHRTQLNVIVILLLRKSLDGAQLTASSVLICYWIFIKIEELYGCLYDVIATITRACTSTQNMSRNCKESQWYC